MRRADTLVDNTIVSVSEATGSEPIWRSILRASPVILLVSLITACIHSFGWLRPFESTTLDTLITLNPVSAKHVFIVEIDNADYKSIFGSRSPLDPEKVTRLVSAIAAGEPKVIVVDLDTSDDRFRGIKLPDTTSSLVWARHAKPSASKHELTEVSTDAAETELTGPLVADRVLGKDVSAALPLSGLTNVPIDSDGIIRHYCRYVGVLEPTSNAVRLVATLPWAAVQSFRGDHNEDAHPSDEEMVLASTGGRKYLPRISTDNLLAICQGQGWKDTVKGKVVLLGGCYDAGRDDYVTASGRLPGVELLAEAIESELSRGGIRPVNAVLLILAQVVASIIVIAVNSRFAAGRAPLIGLLAIPLVAFICSLLSFSSLYLWVDFVPVLFAVQLHYLFDHLKRARQQNVELKQVNAELVRTKHELATAVDRGTEQERKRLAHELHDDTLGQLFQVSVGLQPLSASTADGDKIGRVLDTVHHAMANIRKIMMNLYPPVLDKFGLCAALAELCANQSDSSLKILFSDQSEKLPDRFDKSTQLSLYRIAQEGLNNVRKHAQSSQAEIKLNGINGRFIMSVIDNGKGIGSPTGRADSYGLSGMKNKAVLIGADIRWSSPPTAHPSGTELQVELPSQISSPSPIITSPD